MIDQKLLQQYADAVHARPLIRGLPDGVRQHAQRFEQMCLEDIRAQTGNPDLTEQEILASAKPTIIKIISDAWPLISQVLLVLVKKYWPAVTTSGALSAVITYLATK